MKKPGLITDTGLNYGPCTVLLLIPKRPDVIPTEALESFVHDFTERGSRGRLHILHVTT